MLQAVLLNGPIWSKTDFGPKTEKGQMVRFYPLKSYLVVRNNLNSLVQISSPKSNWTLLHIGLFSFKSFPKVSDMHFITLCYIHYMTFIMLHYLHYIHYIHRITLHALYSLYYIHYITLIKFVVLLFTFFFFF